jgi:hypothetical protein
LTQVFHYLDTISEEEKRKISGRKKIPPKKAEYDNGLTQKGSTKD